MSDLINHPQHYGGKDNPYEAIKVIEAWDLDFSLGQVLKYLCRAGKKPGSSQLEDLRKAQWYLNRSVERIEQQSSSSGTEQPLSAITDLAGLR